ncbi:MAG: hypothetical protein HY912_07845 [Desulfomonile tiedjei]|uniref:Uncharacterized protein n=1 Tax=Desulfomonile tiedjei TaxID=2358 RepID=A0A9D6Z5Q6_9BACT|nr:hypothetical protein [Desulfomonile tiedjei]
MRAEYLGDGAIAVSGTMHVEKFNKIWGGIGWPETKSGYFCVIGEKTDGRYHALWEKQGGLSELGDEAVQAKDRFLIEQIWVDGRDSIATSYIRTLDGLCFYDESERVASHRPVTVTASGWTQFKNQTMTAVVSPVPDRVVNHYRSALEKIRGLIMQGMLLIHERNCPIMMYTIRQPLDDLLKSAVMKALVWVLTALEGSKANLGQPPEIPEPWYKNLPRD